MGANLNKISGILGTGFLFGLFFSPIFEIQIYLIVAMFVAILFLAFLRKSIEIGLISVFLFSFMSGYLYFKIDDKERSSKFVFKEKEVFTLNCKVIGDVEYKNNQKKFQCRPIIDNQKINENVLLYTKDISKDFLHGDILKVEAKFEKPKTFKTDTNTEFEYQEFLKTKNIFYLSFDTKIHEIILSKNNFRRKLFMFRDEFIKPFIYGLKGDSENLFWGILFGKNVLSNDLVDSFRIAGLTHIIALSGYNITIIASWIKSLFLGLGAKASSFFSIVSIILFILMTGVPITAVRAGIMAIISLIALRSGNIYLSLRALFIAVLVMNIINPRLIFYDFSFQLSVLATLGIILFTKNISGRLPFKKPFFLREIIATTISAQIAVLPLILYQTRLLSVLALPANIIILPIIPVIMVFGFLGGIIGLISISLAFPFVLLGDIGLKIVIFISKFVAGLSISSFVFKDFGLIIMLVLYVFIGFYTYKSRVLNLTDSNNV